MHASKANTAPVPDAVPLEDIQVSLEESGNLLVQFTQGDVVHEWSLSRANLYTENATRVAHSGNTSEILGPRSVKYVGRSANETASAVLHEDGRISAMFATVGGVLRVLPVEPQDTRSFGGAKYLIQQAPHLLAVGSGNESVTEDVWGGETWSPGCFLCDNVMHEFQLGVAIDVSAWELYGENAQPMIERAVSQVSVIFEHQMRIRLVIDSVVIHKTREQAPAWAATCGSCDQTTGCTGGGWLSQKLKLLESSDDLPYEGHTHLFTGCGGGSNFVGMSWVGTACEANLNVGVTDINADVFKVFAHELGHNFGAAYSSSGEDESGGGLIVDSAEGLLEGVVQFNTMWRQDPMCHTIDTFHSDPCMERGKFYSTTIPEPQPDSYSVYGYDAQEMSVVCSSGKTSGCCGLRSCAEECSSDPDCRYFSYWEISAQPFCRRSHECETMDDSVHSAHFFQRNLTELPPSCPAGFVFTLVGTETANATDTKLWEGRSSGFLGCGKLCASDMSCRFFSFSHDSQENRCVLHGEYPAQATFKERTSVCGKPEGYDFVHSDGHQVCTGEGSFLLRKTSDGLTDCVQRCSAVTECQFLSFWREGAEQWCDLRASCDAFVNRVTRLAF
jgi:hypothetical protein